MKSLTDVSFIKSVGDLLQKKIDLVSKFILGAYSYVIVLWLYTDKWWVGTKKKAFRCVPRVRTTSLLLFDLGRAFNFLTHNDRLDNSQSSGIIAPLLKQQVCLSRIVKLVEGQEGIREVV